MNYAIVKGENSYADIPGVYIVLHLIAEEAPTTKTFVYAIGGDFPNNTPGIISIKPNDLRTINTKQEIEYLRAKFDINSVGPLNHVYSDIRVPAALINQF